MKPCHICGRVLRSTKGRLCITCRRKHPEAVRAYMRHRPSTLTPVDFGSARFWVDILQSPQQTSGSALSVRASVAEQRARINQRLANRKPLPDAEEPGAPHLSEDE